MNQSVDPGIFTGGQVSQLPPFPNPSFVGTELMMVVIANVANYRITTEELGALLGVFIGVSGYSNTIITSGATIGSPYAPLQSDTRVLLNKTVGAASYVTFDVAANYQNPILIKDMKGDAATNNITIAFSGGQLCDGIATWTIDSAYGWLVFCPLPTAWYQSSF